MGASASFSSEGLSLSCWIYMQQFFAGRVNSAYASCVTEGEALPPACLPAACLPACLPASISLPLVRVLQPAGSSTRNNGDDRWCLWAALCRRHAGTPEGPLLLLLGESQHTSSALSECQGRVFFRKASRPLKSPRWREQPPNTTPNRATTYHRTLQVPGVARGQHRPL